MVEGWASNETASVKVYVCSKDSESNLLLVGEAGSYITDKGARIKAKLAGFATARFSHAEFIVTIVIIGVGWIGLHAEESVSVYNCPC